MSESIDNIRVDEIGNKRGRGRPKSEPKEIIKEIKPKGRPRVENPCQPGRPKDPEYFRQYYHDKVKGLIIICPCCGTETVRASLTNHKKTKACKKIVEYKQESLDNYQQSINFK
jgi:hypothetical protein